MASPDEDGRPSLPNPWDAILEAVKHQLPSLDSDSSAGSKHLLPTSSKAPTVLSSHDRHDANRRALCHVSEVPSCHLIALLILCQALTGLSRWQVTQNWVPWISPPAGGAAEPISKSASEIGVSKALWKRTGPPRQSESPGQGRWVEAEALLALPPAV